MATSKRNKVCVLIPHYNDTEGLIKSIDSIGKGEKVDVVVVDDGSKKQPDEARTNAVFKGDGTIFYLYETPNHGIEHVLNKGLEFILERDYEYIGRLDSGDYCAPDRFAKQEKFLDENKDVALLGTACQTVDEEGNNLYVMNRPADFEVIKKQMFFNSMFVHPCVMFRREVPETIGLYPLGFKAAEDHAYFFDAIKKFKGSNLQEVLVYKEINDHSISALRRKTQVLSKIKIILKNFYFGYHPIVGLIRACIVYIVPRSILIFFKGKGMK